MTVKFTVTIHEEPDGVFIALTDTGGDDGVLAGVGNTPYRALYDLIRDFEDAEFFRPD